MHREEGDWLVCETPQGNALALPIWMTDQTICAEFSLGSLLVALSALRELRMFIDALHSARQCDKSFGKTPPLERPDDKQKKNESAAGGVVPGLALRKGR